MNSKIVVGIALIIAILFATYLLAASLFQLANSSGENILNNAITKKENNSSDIQLVVVPVKEPTVTTPTPYVPPVSTIPKRPRAS
jgi:hypothetical protein